MIFAGLGSVVALVVAGLAEWNLKTPPPGAPLPVSRFTIALPAGQRLDGPDQLALVVSPDGSRLVYAASAGGVQQLYLRAMDSVEARPIGGTEGATAPFFSPDGQWLGFFAGGKLLKVSLSGGVPVTLSSRSFPWGASWNSQGRIAFTPLNGSALQQVSQAGGPAQPLTRLDKGETTHRWPEFLPFGNALLFTVASNPGGVSNNAWLAQSGFPITPLVGFNQSGTGDAASRDVPNRNPNFKGPVILGTDGFRKTGRYFDPNAFLVPPAGTFGNVSRGSFIGPGRLTIDTSLFKKFRVNEKWNLQLRAEAFNVLNHANFNTPNPIVFFGNSISPAAGVITETATRERQIQIALRILF